jgi:hypothetical protein
MTSCPITREPIVHSAFIGDRHEFECSAILHWLGISMRNPCTNEVIPDNWACNILRGTDAESVRMISDAGFLGVQVNWLQLSWNFVRRPYHVIELHVRTAAVRMPLTTEILSITLAMAQAAFCVLIAEQFCPMWFYSVACCVIFNINMAHEEAIFFISETLYWITPAAVCLLCVYQCD